MTQTRWIVLKELFEAALETSRDDRDAWVERVCAGDADLGRDLNRLLTHAEQMGSFLNGTDSGRHRFSQGDWIGGRFEVMEFLGAGGMGEVYSAADRVLGTSIALKTLRADIVSDGRSVERLRREIRLARQVTHGNVCRVFDLEQCSTAHGELMFLTMELISGETLAERIARAGPLAEDEAIDVVEQIALALDAAHRARVIHRDLKPANVMLTRDAQGGRLRVVVMDFGLARLADPAAPATQEIFGTPAYMAPELFDGGDPSIASDIYAFGMTIREMLLPGRENREPANPLRKTALELKWQSVIDRCLEASPERRPAGALQVLAEVTRAKRPQKPGLMRRWITLAAAALAAVALSAGSLRLFEQAPSFPEGGVLLLSDIVNATGERNLEAVTEVFRSQLGQSAYLRLWDRGRLTQVLATMKLPRTEPLQGKVAREVAWREGVPFVLFGSVAPLGDGLNLSLRLERLSSATIFARSAWEFSVHVADKEHLWDGIHEASIWLRRRIGENDKQLAEHDRLPQETTTESWEALREYRTAEQFQAQGQSDTAVAALKTAVHLDPHFALAYMRLGDILMASSRQDEALHYWSLAAEEANRQHLTRREALRIQGLYADDTWDWSGFAAAFAQMEFEYPHDYLASFYLGSALRRLGRFEESAREFEAAAAKTHGSLAVADNLGASYLALGDWKNLEKLGNELTRLGRPDLSEVLTGEELFAMHDFPRARDQFQSASKHGSAASRSRAIWFDAAALAEMGRISEAQSVLENGMRFDGDVGLRDQRAAKSIALASLALRRGDRSTARVEALAAAADAGGPSQLLQSAIVLASMGAQREADQIVERIRGTAPHTRMAEIAESRVRGEELLERGQGCAAVDTLRRWDSIESYLRPREPLARALAVCGQPEQALTIYDESQEIRHVIYGGPLTLFPGMFTDMLVDEARCAIKAHQIVRAQKLVAESLRFRASADSNDPVQRTARELNSSIAQGERPTL